MFQTSLIGPDWGEAVTGSVVFCQPSLSLVTNQKKKKIVMMLFSDLETLISDKLLQLFLTVLVYI